MRDVIRVERHADTAEDVPETGRPLGPTWEGPSIDTDALAAVGRVADEVLPSIVARLAVSGLGELEVRHGDWRVRVRRAVAGAVTDDAPARGGATGESAPQAEPVAPGAPTASTSAGRSPAIATSPAVGYVTPRSDLPVGARAAQGDVIGWIDVLGVRQEVVAPVDGLVGKWFVGPSDPVEYGQELVQLVPGGSQATRPGTDGAEA